jgi:hypothetical protein
MVDVAEPDQREELTNRMGCVSRHPFSLTAVVFGAACPIRCPSIDRDEAAYEVAPLVG